MTQGHKLRQYDARQYLISFVTYGERHDPQFGHFMFHLTSDLQTDEDTVLEIMRQAQQHVVAMGLESQGPPTILAISLVPRYGPITDI